jgi:nucleoside-diphosphate-sugar epimerase
MIERLIHLHNSLSVDIFNLSGNEITHLGAIAEMISSALHRESIVRWTDDEPSFLIGSNEKIGRTLNYRPKVSFREGISHSVSNCFFCRICDRRCFGIVFHRLKK